MTPSSVEEETDVEPVVRGSGGNGMWRGLMLARDDRPVLEVNEGAESAIVEVVLHEGPGSVCRGAAFQSEKLV